MIFGVDFGFVVIVIYFILKFDYAIRILFRGSDCGSNRSARKFKFSVFGNDSSRLVGIFESCRRERIYKEFVRIDITVVEVCVRNSRSVLSSSENVFRNFRVYAEFNDRLAFPVGNDCEIAGVIFDF